MSLSTAFERVPAGASAAPAPRSLRVWFAQTFAGIAGGMLWGGWQGLIEARDLNRAAPVAVKSHRERAAVFFVQGSLSGGARIGMFVAMFSGILLTLQHSREEEKQNNVPVSTTLDNATNTALAGAASTGLFAARAGLRAAAPASAMGLVAGAALGGVQGMLKDIAGIDPFDIAIGKENVPTIAKEDVENVVINLQLAIEDTRIAEDIVQKGAQAAEESDRGLDENAQ